SATGAKVRPFRGLVNPPKIDYFHHARDGLGEGAEFRRPIEVPGRDGTGELRQLSERSSSRCLARQVEAQGPQIANRCRHGRAFYGDTVRGFPQEHYRRNGNGRAAPPAV